MNYLTIRAFQSIYYAVTQLGRRITYCKALSIRLSQLGQRSRIRDFTKLKAWNAP